FAGDAAVHQGTLANLRLGGEPLPRGGRHFDRAADDARHARLNRVDDPRVGIGCRRAAAVLGFGWGCRSGPLPTERLLENLAGAVRLRVEVDRLRIADSLQPLLSQS